jgi:signal transduction histidine kinase
MRKGQAHMDMPYLIGVLAGLTLISLAVVAVQARLISRVRHLEKSGAPRRSGSRVLAADAATPESHQPEATASRPSVAFDAPAQAPTDTTTGATGSTAGPSVGIATMNHQLGLLARQLELLDGLEKREDRENQLAVLFQIDNLTLRLRRGAESALVLADVVPERRATEDLTATATLRAACAQIEEYARIEVDAQIDPMIHADHVAPLSHLLAELLDNATRFAPASTPVTARVEPAADGLVMTISDLGGGMDATTLIAAQDALTGRRSSTSGTTGLLVAGRQAHRIGCSITLDSTPTGTTARVAVPGRLLLQRASVGHHRAEIDPTPNVPAQPAAPTWEPALADNPFGTAGLGTSGPSPVDATFGSPAAPQPIEPVTPHASLAEPSFDALISAESTPVVPAPPVELPGPAFAPVSSGFEQPTHTAGAPSPAPEFGFGEPVAAAPSSLGTFDPMPSTQQAPQDGWIVPAGAGVSATASSSVRDEVLAELSRLSGYSPAAPASASELQPRTPSPTPELQPVGAGPADRDPDTVRGRFSSFRSGVGRGRRSRD